MIALLYQIKLLLYVACLVLPVNPFGVCGGCSEGKACTSAAGCPGENCYCSIEGIDGGRCVAVRTRG